jgi:serine protease Do
MQRMRQIHRLLAMNTAIPEIDLCQLAFTDHSSRSPLMSRQLSLAIFFLALTAATFAQNPVAQTRDQKVRGDKAKVEADGFWIYNDLNRGFAEAKKTGMPLIVVLRCIPCEQCVKLDDDLVDKDERLRPLLEKFVRVRVISANGLDLSLFQYDTDQSFAVFLLNADRTIYGRFGTRSDQRNWTDDVSIAGLAKALEGALALHQAYPANKAQLAAKTGPAPDFAAPEKYPKLATKYGSELNYEGNVVQSCIHCHQIGDAQREFHRQKAGAIPEQVLFPYPHPKALGLILDPQQCATVLSVDSGSPADQAGFRAGDIIQSLNGQPILSLADVQWVLHHIPAKGGSVTAAVVGPNKARNVTLNLSTGWRQRDEIAWRVSSWELRRMGLGAMLLKPLSPAQRAELKLPDTGLALRVEHVGQFPPHDIAKKAGVLKEDILVSFNGRTDFTRETDLLAYALNEIPVGTKVPATFLRNGEKVNVELVTR